MQWDIMLNRCYAYLIVLLLLLPAAPARGEDTSDDLSLDIAATEARPVSTTLSPRPTSKVAENVTIVTAEQIKALNAHSLAEVLQTVPGIYVFNTRTPGGFTFFTLQGEDDGNANTLLFIDGVSQGNLLQGTNDPGLIPVQHIERVEIIKGSASAAWGAALGGVINVVTKSPEPGRPYSGMASASYGERNTADLIAELSGTSHGVGYYLMGGNLHSAGLLPNNGINRNNLYGKLNYELPTKGSLTIGSSYIGSKRGSTEVYAFDFAPPFNESDYNKDHRYYSFIKFTYPLLPDLTLEMFGHDSKLKGQSINSDDVTMTPGLMAPYAHYVLDERNSGAKVKLIWGDSSRNLTSGIDYLHSRITQVDQLNSPTPFDVDRSRDNLSYYANGTLSFGRLTLLPGIRYDKTGLDENTINYTLGATYQLTGKTLLRGYGARGFAMPSAVLQNVPQRIWTLQTGIESEAIPYLWLKGTFFYNHIWKIQDFQDDPPTFHERDRQGFEIEAKTFPLNGFSLSGGYTYTDTRDSDTKERIKGVPVSLVKLALNYSKPAWGTSGLLTGNYAFLNMDDWHYSHDRPMIWNLHLTQQLSPGKELSPELFFNLNNIFNGAQYWDYWYKTAPRWVEGGVRFSF